MAVTRMSASTVIESGRGTMTGGAGVIATGGTVTEYRGKRYHTFTGSGTFEVVYAPAGVTMEYVVIGGGAGGATAARYIAKDSKGEIDVTLAEPSRSYNTCFFSNHYTGA